MAAFASLTVLDAKRGEYSTPAAYSGLLTAVATNGASSATYGAYFTMKDLGAKYLVIAENTAASGDDATVTVKAGNSKQSLGADYACTTLGYGEYVIFTVDSGRVIWVDSDATMKALTSATAADQVDPKGKVFITGSTTSVKVAVIKLP